MVQLSNNEYKINNRKTRVSVYNFQQMRKTERKLYRGSRVFFRKLSISQRGLDPIFRAVNKLPCGYKS